MTNEDNEIIPRTRTHKNEKIKIKEVTDRSSLNKTTDQYSKEELEKILNNIPRTNEQKKLENDQWSWENKIWLILACIIIIIILILGAYILWSSDSDLRDFESKNKNPPGTNTNNIPLKYLEKYSMQPPLDASSGTQNTNSIELKINDQKSVPESKDLHSNPANQNFNNIKKKIMKLRNTSIVKLNNNEPHKILNPKSKNTLTQVPNEKIDNPTVLDVFVDNKKDDQNIKVDVLDQGVTHQVPQPNSGLTENDHQPHQKKQKAKLEVLDENELDNDIQQAVDTTSMFS